MAQRNYSIQTAAVNKTICYEALLKKIDMVYWEKCVGLVENVNSALSQEIKELLENYHVKVSKEAMTKFNLGTAWTVSFRNSKNFNAVSTKIMNTIQSGGIFTSGIWRYLDKGEVRWEHSVPTTILVEEIIEMNNSGALNYNSFVNLVDKYGFVSIITADEDLRLNSAGLRQKMPSNWSIKNNDPAFARYYSVGITI